MSILSAFFLISAKVFHTIAWPVYFLYAKIVFWDAKVNRLAVDDRGATSFVFLITFSDASRWVFKRVNPIVRFYDRVFIGYLMMQDKALFQVVQDLQKTKIGKAIPQCRLYKNKLLWEYLSQYQKLFNLLDKNEYGKDQVASVKLKLEKIIASLNNAGYIHGDIKAKNIFISHGGEVKIIDWDGLRVPQATEKELDQDKLRQVFINRYF